MEADVLTKGEVAAAAVGVVVGLTEIGLDVADPETFDWEVVDL